MHIIDLTPLAKGIYNDHASDSITAPPDGWAYIPEGFPLPKTFPRLASIEAEESTYTGEDGAEYTMMTVTAMTEGVPPEPDISALETEARAKRDRLLAETDWTQVLDAPIDAATREAYRVYRQALRDVPEQDGFPQTIVWPELPAVGKAEPDPVDTAVDVLLGGEEE